MEFPTQCFGCVFAEANFSVYNRSVGAEAAAFAEHTAAEASLNQETNPDAKAALARVAEQASQKYDYAKSDRERTESTLAAKFNRCSGYNGQNRRCGFLEST